LGQGTASLVALMKKGIGRSETCTEFGTKSYQIESRTMCLERKRLTKWGLGA